MQTSPKTSWKGVAPFGTLPSTLGRYGPKRSSTQRLDVAAALTMASCRSGWRQSLSGTCIIWALAGAADTRQAAPAMAAKSAVVVLIPAPGNAGGAERAGGDRVVP